MSSICEEHKEIIKNHAKLYTSIAVIEMMLTEIKDKVISHIEDGERRGGYRDRLVTVENQNETLQKELIAIKKGIWKIGVTAGVIGGLIGHGTPELAKFILKVVLG